MLPSYPNKMVSMRTLLVLFLVALASADLYLHNPPGSNNRNRERKDNRNNGNRLFDSQNNGKGGYAWRGDPQIKGIPDPLTYYVGSKLRVEWTNQHACGANPDIHCELVIQYACNDTMEGLRDGYPNADTCYDSTNNNNAQTGDAATCSQSDTWVARNFALNNGDGTNTIPTPINTGLNSTQLYARYVLGEQNYIEYGLHEDHVDYTSCYTTERNKGLYTSDQTLNGNTARFTRQNPNGNRRGLECPEERDYYPYWRPTPWKDLAVLVSDISYCDFYKSTSANVVAYGYCECPNPSQGNPCPITESQCNTQGFNWNQGSSQGVSAPECLYHPFNRDNHLGNSYEVDPNTGEFVTPRTGDEPSSPHYDLTIPSDMQNKQCILRVRYNMSTNDYDSHAFADSSNIPGASNSPKGVGVTSQQNCPFVSVSDVNNCAGGAQDVDCDTSSSTGDKPQCYGSFTATSTPLYNRPYINLFNKDTTAAVAAGFRLGIAINTHQTGRTFQDRSYVFNVAASPVDGTITNLGLRGRRGNIVQAYPSVEYDFVPLIARVRRGDYLHIQFHGSDFNAQKNANNGEGWQYSDRTNFVEMASRTNNYPVYHESATFFTSAQAEKFAWVEQSPTACNTTVTDDDGPNNRDNQNYYKNCGKLNMMKNRFPANARDGLVFISQNPGDYHFMSTRNNNFSNRSQKSQVTVEESESDEGLSTGAKVAIAFSVIFATGAGAAAVAIYMKKKKKGCFADKDDEDKGAYNPQL